MTPIVVGVSGTGRTLANLLATQHRFAYQVKAVVSTSSEANAVKIAQSAGLPVFIDDFKADCSQKLTNWLSQWPGCWVALAGFLRRWPELPTQFSRTINVHPALLPDFGGKGMYGRHVHEAIIRSKKRFSGASVHFVTDEYDAGSIISRIKVKVLADDTAETLAARVFAAECYLYPRTLHKLVIGELPLENKEAFDYGLYEP